MLETIRSVVLAVYRCAGRLPSVVDQDLIVCRIAAVLQDRVICALIRDCAAHPGKP